MSIKFKAVEKHNPLQKESQRKYYASAVVQKKLSLDELASLISDGSTVRRNDIYAVLIGLVDVTKRELAQGNLVQLGDLGSFTVNVSSEGKETPEALTAHHIESSKIIFRPAVQLRDMLKTLRFEKI
jgi:predicted histone-like DNA-binding protein